MRKWAAVAAGAVILSAFLLVSEGAPRARAAAAEVRAWRAAVADVTAAEGWEAEVARLDGERAALQRSISAQLVLASGDERFSAVLRHLRDTALESGAELVGVEPLSRREHESHDEVRVRTGLRGGYHAIARALSALERSPYRARVVRLSMSADGLGSGEVSALVELELALTSGAGQAHGATPAPTSQRVQP